MGKGSFWCAVGWLGGVVVGMPLLFYLLWVVFSDTRAAASFGYYYGLFVLVEFLAAVPVLAVVHRMPGLKGRPAVVRAVVAAGLVYLISLFVPLLAPMARYPLHFVRCGGPPIVGTVFAAAYSYVVPSSPSYAVTPLDDRFFCTEGEARAARFHPRKF